MSIPKFGPREPSGDTRQIGTKSRAKCFHFCDRKHTERPQRYVHRSRVNRICPVPLRGIAPRTRSTTVVARSLEAEWQVADRVTNLIPIVAKHSSVSNWDRSFLSSFRPSNIRATVWLVLDSCRCRPIDTLANGLSNRLSIFRRNVDFSQSHANIGYSEWFDDTKASYQIVPIFFLWILSECESDRCSAIGLFRHRDLRYSPLRDRFARKESQ